MAKKSEQLLYRGKPLVRDGNTLYYGDLAEPYIAVIQITESEERDGKEVATTLATQILSTDENLPILKRIKKNGVQKNLFDAVNLASIWLKLVLDDENALNEE